MELSVVFVIVLFSIIQSIIGVGILLFGTPTLLLMGYNYHETLYLILPSSIVISLIQATNKRQLIANSKHIYTYTLPMTIVGLLMVTLIYNSADIRYIVGGMLVLIGFIRSTQLIKQYLVELLYKHIILYHLLMGWVHGVSNMGGGLLVVLMGSIHKEREVILANIAYTYLLFGIIQIGTLYIFSKEEININAFFLAVFSLAMYMVSTKFLVKKVSDVKFNSLITTLIFSYGLLSFIKI